MFISKKIFLDILIFIHKLSVITIIGHVKILCNSEFGFILNKIKCTCVISTALHANSERRSKT